jgi:triacylglycerol lipase
MSDLDKLKFAWHKYYNAQHLDDFKSEEDTDGFIGFYEDTLLICFYGTNFNQWKDVKNDIYFCKKVIPYDGVNPKVKVHAGFLRSYKSVRDYIHNIIKSHPYNKITIFGHSLGGAVSTLCAVDVQYNFPEKEIECYSWGSPRVGNSAFVKSYNSRVPNTYRCVNSEDLVAKLPPFFFFFKHVDKLVFVGKKKWYRCLGCVNDHQWWSYQSEMDKP